MTIRETRGLFARCLLGACDVEPVSIGSIVLRRHQQTAVTRVNAAIGEFGGALVSDHVGTGKTYVALAVAAKCTETTVVAPAVLEDMWLKAASKADVPISFVSTESLSRHATPMPGRNVSVARRLVIVDEAQHFRNPATRRFASLAHLCSERVVILLSATPIHNRKRDLQTLLSLFIGSRAARLSSSELGRIVIRRSRDHIAGSAFMPEVVAPQWCDLTHDDEVPELLLALPPPLSPRDGGDGGALVVHSLIRQWVSSDRALHRALVRRLQKATALMTALESGTYPSESDLTSWICGEDCVQLGFAALLSPADAASAVSIADRSTPRVGGGSSGSASQGLQCSGSRARRSNPRIAAKAQRHWNCRFLPVRRHGRRTFRAACA
jgi:DNA or RNA helicases of superfamily II